MLLHPLARRASLVPLAALALAALGLGAAPALAQRPATAKQTRSLARVLDLPARCVTGSISSVDRSWAKVTANVNDDEACLRANGVVVLHRGAAGHWRAIIQAADAPTARCIGVKGRVPVRVVTDLRVCRLS